MDGNRIPPAFQALNTLSMIVLAFHQPPHYKHQADAAAQRTPSANASEPGHQVRTHAKTSSPTGIASGFPNRLRAKANSGGSIE